MASLKGKVALITGASSGIGSAVARHFASLGCHVSLTGRDEGMLQEVGKDCQECGLTSDQILMQIGDLGKDVDIERIFNKTVVKFGRLDILVNNAATATIRPFATTTMESFDQIMRVNMRAVFYLTQLATPHLINSKGSVVNVSSVSSKEPCPSNIAYSMSKYMINQFTKNAAVELATHGVRVNSICPGVVHTRIFDRGGIKWDTVAKNVKMRIPLGRCGDEKEMASAIAFLASDDSASVTGHSMSVDGGRQHMPGAGPPLSDG